MLDVETGTGAIGVLIVAVDGGDRVFFHQVADELVKGEALGFGAGVGGMAVGIKAADIGDANAVGIMAFGVCARLLYRTASVDAAVGVDDVMIADVAPAEGTVVAAYALHGTDGVWARGGAMDDDFGDCSHGDLFFKRGRGWVLGASSRWLEIRRR